MYTNINKTHGINTIEKWLELHKSELLETFPPIYIIVKVLEEVRTNNVFCLLIPTGTKFLVWP